MFICSKIGGYLGRVELNGKWGRTIVTIVLKKAAGGRQRGGGFSKGLPQSPGWLRIVQVLQGFQGNLDEDRNILKVNIGESAQLLMDLSSDSFI